MRRPPASPAYSIEMLKRIAEFYAGRPITDITFQPGIGLGRTAENGQILLAPEVEQSLRAFFKNPRSRGTVAPGVLGLVTLIHEAIHNRDFGSTDSNVRGPSGFFAGSNERQAGALGSELLPDLLNRFFGIPIDSSLSNAYLKAAKGLSSYQGAYAGDVPVAPWLAP